VDLELGLTRHIETLHAEKHKAQTSALLPCAPCLVWCQHEGIG